MALITSAAIAGGAALAGQGINAFAQGNLNRKNRRFAQQMWNKQGDRELEYWNMQNAYNDPAAQMQRLSDAGLNPNLVYGSGATTEAASASPKPAHTPSTDAPRVDLGSVAQQAMMMKQMEANIAKTNAETQWTQARAGLSNFDLAIKNVIGVNTLAKVEFKEAMARDSRAHRSRFTDDNFVYMALGGRASDDPDSPLSKAVLAQLGRQVTELQGAVKLNNIRDQELIMKKMVNELAKEGIYPNSPWFIKWFRDLVDTIKNLDHDPIFDMPGSPGDSQLFQLYNPKFK